MKVRIDIKDLVRANKFSWHLNDNGYVRRSDSKIYLHQFIIGKKDGLVVDHIDRDKLNNSKSNLRHATRTENNLNSNRVINAKGIYFDKNGNRWRACISVKNKTLKLGSFKTQEEAIEARRLAELKYR